MKLMLLAILIGFSLNVLSATHSAVATTVVKSSDNRWVLTYKMKEPVSRLGFIRNPDNSRTERWLPVDTEFEIVSDNNKEYLQRKDGLTFLKVSINLTPTYKHLAKDYAPFSPFSDGGTLIHTGRLFACVNECTEETTSWPITLTIPQHEHMIVEGKVVTKTHSWLDSADGSKVYVGKQIPVQTANVVAVIDKGLPDQMRASLDRDIPLLMDFFEPKLGKLAGVKPTLFASYAKVDGHSSQGGTLPNQIFMHWNVNDLSDKVADSQFVSNTLWFFAHEVAHLYQHHDEIPLYGNAAESWLHEGNADWLAHKVLTELYPETQQYANGRIASARKKCAEGLGDFSLSEAAANGRFDLYYSCGLLIHKAIDEVLESNPDMDIFSLWNTYRNQILQGEQAGAHTFLATTRKFASAELADKISQILYEPLANPEKALNQL